MEARREFQDCCGNPLTCESQEALELYNDILESFISQKKSFIGSLNHVIELDNTFVLAHCLMVHTYIHIYMDHCIYTYIWHTVQMLKGIWKTLYWEIQGPYLMSGMGGADSAFIDLVTMAIYFLSKFIIIGMYAMWHIQ